MTRLQRRGRGASRPYVYENKLESKPMHNLKLVPPTREMQPEFMAMLHEYRAADDNWFEREIGLDDDDFDAYLQHLQDGARGIVHNGLVPWTALWLVDEKNSILGVVSLRHHLNDYLRFQGGHIGYTIRPSQRRAGFGAAILALALEEARTLQLERVLLTCDPDNIASARIIVKNGGVFEVDEDPEPRMPVSRYWIDL